MNVYEAKNDRATAIASAFYGNREIAKINSPSGISMNKNANIDIYPINVFFYCLIIEWDGHVRKLVIKPLLM